VIVIVMMNSLIYTKPEIFDFESFGAHGEEDDTGSCYVDCIAGYEICPDAGDDF